MGLLIWVLKLWFIAGKTNGKGTTPRNRSFEVANEVCRYALHTVA